MTKGILYIGSPLLDITVSCDGDFLQRYGLKPDDCIQVTDSELFDLIMKKPTSVITSGGSAQNSARVSKWLLRDQCEVSFAGCVGNDDYAEKMKLDLQSIGVHPLYHYHDTLPTGICACLVAEKGKRSLCTRLGAAFSFSVNHLSSKEVQTSMENANIIYVVGYLLSHSPNVVLKAAEIAHSMGKLFALNLSAPYICESFSARILECMPYIDVIIGNKAEARAFLHSLGVPFIDIKQCTKVIASLPKKPNQYGQRVCVISQGAKDVVLGQGEKDPEFYSVPPIPDIVDTVGCGDALVGGIMATLSMNGTLHQAVKSGIDAAVQIVQTIGCTIPGQTMDYP